MKPIAAETCEEGWLLASEHLVGSADNLDYNVVVEIQKPVLHRPVDLAVRTLVDSHLRAHEANPIATVADTIFPTSEYLNYGARGVYEVYPDEVYPEILVRGEWGRYAHRLVRWPPSASNDAQVNPLKSMVGKMCAQLEKTAPKRGCYEITLTDSAIDLPLYDPQKDATRPMSGPCLSHLSFKLGPDSNIFLTALYRSHYYVARALGNFIGLAALQGFVCDQTGLCPGPLVCVSSYAKLDTGERRNGRSWGIAKAKALVAAARRAFDREQE